MAQLGIDLQRISGQRRPLCRTCLDWSARRSHLSGSLGAALLEKCYELGWARYQNGSRIVRFTIAGERAFREKFLYDRRAIAGIP